jgi:2-polyprenyl-3-methyl-5-hydroxy-6-metoxy-1,4-benzoquinol methylase
MNRKLRRAARSGDGGTMRGSGPESGFGAALLEQGQRLLASGRDEEAMDVAKQVVRLHPTDECKAFFIQCIRHWNYFPGAEDLSDVLAAAYREVWGNPFDLFGITIGLLGRDPTAGALMRRVAAAWPRRVTMPELIDGRSLGVIAANPLLLALLEFGRVLDIDLERAMTSIRAALLDMALAERRVDASIVRFSCALARQCFNNEYVFDVTVEEQALSEQLRERVSSAIAAGAAIPPLMIAVLAAYQPLDLLPASSSLVRRSWPAAVQALLDEQVRQPAAERQHRESIARITPIADATSVTVRDQYEQHPYPRWRSVPKAARQMPVDEWFEHDFPFSEYRPTGKTTGFEVLIAGCGTGRHSILYAQVCQGAKILAVDLSLASLCYAKQKTLEMGLTNIEYAQADILELGRLSQTFDVISSSGVLHHLADPERGWRTLLPLLRPDGCMHIGLYSERAQAGVAVAQSWLRERGYGPRVEEIRRGRQDLASTAVESPPLKTVLGFSDFYATSECRDLLLPAQQVRFTIPQIQAFLDANDLQFIGFLVPGEVQAQFSRRFSRERQSELQSWHEFEAENPDTFKNMYEFWVQKRASP